MAKSTYPKLAVAAPAAAARGNLPLNPGWRVRPFVPRSTRECSRSTGFTGRVPGWSSHKADVRQVAGCVASVDDTARFLRELRQLRDGAGLGHAELAARAHYPYDCIKAAEVGPALPDLPVLSAYVRGCGGTAEEWEERWRSLTRTPSLPVPEARQRGRLGGCRRRGAHRLGVRRAPTTPIPSIIIAALNRVAEGMAGGSDDAPSPSADAGAWPDIPADAEDGLPADAPAGPQPDAPSWPDFPADIPAGFEPDNPADSQPNAPSLPDFPAGAPAQLPAGDQPDNPADSRPDVRPRGPTSRLTAGPGDGTLFGCRPPGQPSPRPPSTWRHSPTTARRRRGRRLPGRGPPLPRTRRQRPRAAGHGHRALTRPQRTPPVSWHGPRVVRRTGPACPGPGSPHREPGSWRLPSSCSACSPWC